MVAAYLGKLRLFNRDVRLYLATAVLRGFAWDGIRVVLFNLYLLRLGYGPEFIGVVNGAGALAFSLFCLPAGLLDRRWGSRRLLIAGLSLAALGLGLLPLAELAPDSWQAGWLVTMYVVVNLGFALYFVNGLPFLMSDTGPEERHYAFSVHIALVPLAAFAGSLVGGLLPGLTAVLLSISTEDPAAYRTSIWLASLAMIPAVWAMAATRPAHARRGKERVANVPLGHGATVSAGSVAPYALIIMLSVVVMFRFGAWGALTTFFNVYLDDALSAPTVLIGLLVAGAQLAAVPAALAAPLVVERWGNRRTITFGSLAMGLAMLPLALIPHWGVAGLGYLGTSIAYYLTTGPIRVYSQEIVPPAWRGTMSGAVGLGAGLSMSAVSLSGGFAIAALGYPSVFLTGAALAFAGALLFWAYFRVPRGELASQDAAAGD